MKHTTKTADRHFQKELPDIIYLQLHGDNEYVGNNEEIDFGDVTWSEERMYLTDVEYAKVKSPWISVKERLPEDSGWVFVAGRCYKYRVLFYCGGKFYTGQDLSAYDGGVTHWMPIPSFDEILEANKDVLERIKQKGD